MANEGYIGSIGNGPTQVINAPVKPAGTKGGGGKVTKGTDLRTGK